MPIPDVLNEAFHDVDANLSRMCEESEGKIHSGCTAVTAFLRLEDASGKQPFRPRSATPPPLPPPEPVADDPPKSSGTGSRLRNAIRSLGSSSSPSSPSLSRKPSAELQTVDVVNAPRDARRVLYAANVGDARAVLCRGGKAVRLTYDHKGSDKQEAKRITDAGGFVMSGRVNGVLAVTRSLGDSSMKEFVVGAPYTTETELCEEDEFVILACDGLWDVATDQAAVDLVREVANGGGDAQVASQKLLKYAMSNHVSLLLLVASLHLLTSLEDLGQCYHRCYLFERLKGVNAMDQTSVEFVV